VLKQVSVAEDGPAQCCAQHCMGPSAAAETYLSTLIFSSYSRLAHHSCTQRWMLSVINGVSRRSN